MQIGDVLEWKIVTHLSENTWSIVGVFTNQTFGQTIDISQQHEWNQK